MASVVPPGSFVQLGAVVTIYVIVLIFRRKIHMAGMMKIKTQILPLFIQSKKFWELVLLKIIKTNQFMEEFLDK